MGKKMDGPTNDTENLQNSQKHTIFVTYNQNQTIAHGGS